MPDFDPSLILRHDPPPPEDGSFLSLLGAPPKESPPLTLEDLRRSIDSMFEREERDAEAQRKKYLSFINSLPEGMMDSPVLTQKELAELHSIATIVGYSVISPLNPRDAQGISKRVGVLVAKHKRWSPS